MTFGGPVARVFIKLEWDGSPQKHAIPTRFGKFGKCCRFWKVVKVWEVLEVWEVLQVLESCKSLKVWGLGVWELKVFGKSWRFGEVLGFVGRMRKNKGRGRVGAGSSFFHQCSGDC